jgi:hypothetical protein
MWRITGSLAVIGLLALAIPVRAQDDAKVREVVDRAIKAHGGLDNLTKLKANVSKSKGKFYLMGQAVDFTGETSLQLPDRFRNEVHSKFGDQEFTFIEVINGDKGWAKSRGMTIDMNKEMLAEAKEQMHGANLSQLVCLKEKDYKLSPLGEMKIGDRPAIGVRVERKGYRDVSLYFDKDKNLLLKLETRVKDFTQGGQEFTSTTVYSDYKKVGGMMVAYKVTIERDGKPFVEAENTEVKVSEKLDDSVFDKP